MTNPCGHSFCGACSWTWVVEKKRNVCPVCRHEIDEYLPFTPNIVVDNLVSCYIRMLPLLGHQGWARGGRMFNEWNQRQKDWKNGETNRQRRLIRRGGIT